MAAALLEDEASNSPRGYLLEVDLEAAMLTALAGGGGPAPRRRRQIQVPNWKPQPGQVDVLVPQESGLGRPLYLAELKWCNSNKIFEGLYDALKMVWAATLPGVEGAYLVYGAPVRFWEKPVEAAELFVGGEVDLAGLVERYADWWQRYILDDSSGRPLAAPERASVEVVATAGLSIGEHQWRLVTIAVCPASDQIVAFEGGVPRRAGVRAAPPEHFEAPDVFGDEIPFPERQVVQAGDDLPAAVFSAKRDHRWRWELENVGHEPESVDLAVVLERLPLASWTRVVQIHCGAVAAAFAQLAVIERVLNATEGEADAEFASVELIATVMTLQFNVEALLEECHAATPLLLGRSAS